jgi:hypothetical protein
MNLSQHQMEKLSILVDFSLSQVTTPSPCRNPIIVLQAHPITFIVDPISGSISQDRAESAIKDCQCLAAMGKSPTSLTDETTTFDQFYVRLTFDDDCPAAESFR